MSEVIIRALELADLDDLAEIYMMPKCQRETLQLPYQSRDEVKRRFETPNPDRHTLVAVLKENGKVVGNIGLHPTKRERRAHVGQIGMMVHDDYQGQGIGSKLLATAIELGERWLNYRRIELEVYTDNEPAIRLYQKFGFVIEGTMRQFAFRDGVYVDAYMMARLREE
jgi:L-phenylalanine/L-methionine N-acetyltransferase